jgi:hypothetical protein
VSTSSVLIVLARRMGDVHLTLGEHLAGVHIRDDPCGRGSLGWRDIADGLDLDVWLRFGRRRLGQRRDG